MPRPSDAQIHPVLWALSERNMRAICRSEATIQAQAGINVEVNLQLGCIRWWTDNTSKQARDETLSKQMEKSLYRRFATTGTVETLVKHESPSQNPQSAQNLDMKGCSSHDLLFGGVQQPATLSIKASEPSFIHHTSCQRLKQAKGNAKAPTKVSAVTRILDVNGIGPNFVVGKHSGPGRFRLRSAEMEGHRITRSSASFKQRWRCF
jgi:hypothetical protein